MQTVNIKKTKKENIDSSIAKEIDSFNNQKNTHQRKFLNYFIPIAFFGFLIYKTIFPKLFGNELFSKFSIILLFGTIAICIIVFCCLYFRKYLISESSYEIFDIDTNCAFTEDIIYFSYLNSDKKLKKCKLYSNDLLHHLYLTDVDNAYVVVENYGRNGKITKEVITKFFCNKEQYKDFSITFSWSRKLV